MYKYIYMCVYIYISLYCHIYKAFKTLWINSGAINQEALSSEISRPADLRMYAAAPDRTVYGDVLVT